MPWVASRPARLRSTGLDLRPRLLVPVGDEVGFARHAVVEDVEQRVDVVVAEAAPQQLAAQERRVADDELGLGPLGLRGFVGSDRSRSASRVSMWWSGRRIGSRR